MKVAGLSGSNANGVARHQYALGSRDPNGLAQHCDSLGLECSVLIGRIQVTEIGAVDGIFLVYREGKTDDVERGAEIPQRGISAGAWVRKVLFVGKCGLSARVVKGLFRETGGQHRIGDGIWHIPGPVGAARAGELGQLVAGIAGVNIHRYFDLMNIVERLGDFSFFLRLGQSRQKHRGQNGNDCNDYKEFNQCESGKRATIIGSETVALKHPNWELTIGICSYVQKHFENLLEKY